VHSEAVKCAPPSRPGHHRRQPSADLGVAALTAGIPTQNLCEDSQTTNIANVAKSRAHKINELRTVFQIRNTVAQIKLPSSASHAVGT
jgi:hypothetical protein